MPKSFKTLSPQMLQAFESVPDLYLILSPALMVLTTSNAYLAASHTERENIAGKYLFDVFSEDGSEITANTIKNLKASLRQVLATKKPHRMDVQRYDLPQPAETGGGFISKYWLPLNTPVLDDKGELLFIIHKVEDVTEEVETRRNIEEALLKPTEDLAHTGSYQADLVTGTFYFSDGFFRLFGEEPGSFELSLDFIDGRSHPDDIASVKEVLNQAVIDKQPYYYTRRIYARNGEQRTLEAHGEVVCDREGKAIKFLGLVQDITERKNSQDEMLRVKDLIARQASDKYRTLFEAIDEGFFRCEVLFDDSGSPTDIYYLEANPAATCLLGEDFTGRRLKDIHPDYEAYWYDTFGRVAQTGRGERLEQYAEPDKKWYSFYVFKVDDDRSQVAVIFKDITERKLQEEALRQSEAQIAADLAGMRRLYELQSKLAEQTDVKAAFQEVLAVACEFTNTDRGCVQFLSSDGARLEMFVWQGYADDSPFIEFFRYEGLEQGCEVARVQRQRMIIEETVGFEGLDGTEAGAASYADGIRAAQSTPMTSRSNETIGVISTQFWQPHRPSDHELRLMDMLAWTAAEYLERHRANAALRESEEKYRMLFNSIDEGFCTIEVLFDEQERAIDYRFLDTNPTFKAQTGLDDVTGKTMRELEPKHEDFWFETYGKVALTGESIRFEAYGAALNRWFSVYALRVGEPDNRQVVIVFSDISESKRAEAALRESEARLQKAIAIETVGIIFFDDEGNLTGCNDAFLQMSGFPREQIESGEISWLDLTPPEWMARSGEAFAELQQKGRTTPYEKEYFRLDGSRYWGLVAASNIDENESVEYIIDISTRKCAEEALRKTEEQYRIQLEQKVAQRTAELRESTELLQSMFDTTLLGMLVLKAVRNESGAIKDFTIQLANKELQRETKRNDLEGKHYAKEFPGIKQAGLFDLMLQVMETGEPAGRECYYPHDGFDKWFSCMFVKLGDGLIATNLDITARKQAEQELVKNYQILQQAEQVSRMGSWEYDMTTENFTWGEGMYRLFNLPMGQPVSPEIYLDFALQEDLPIAEKIVQDIKKPRQGFAETLRILVDEQEVTLKIKAIVQDNIPGAAEKVLGVDLDISEVKQLEQENLKLRLQQQQQLLNAILEAQEEERRRISESLHNGVGQLLFATKLNLEGVNLDAPVERKPAVAESLQKTNSLLMEAIAETRRVSHELVPVLLKDYGLQHAIEELCTRFTLTGIKLDCHCFPERLPDLLETAIYRIGQELINNIVKHSEATRANLEVSKDHEFVYLDARDNGKGFNWESVENGKHRKGIGLRTIQDRIKLLDGTLEIDSSPEKGTVISIRLPLGD